MKKWKRLFSLVCAFAMIFSLNTTAFAAELPKTDTKQQYEITVGDEAITLEEGEVVEIPMTLIENDESGIQPSSSSQTIVGTCKVPVKKVCINTFMQTFLLHISHCLHK